MNKPPKDFDSHFLVGKRVESIAVAAYQVNIYLSERVWIQIEGHYELIEKGIRIENIQTFPISQTLLPRIIGRTATRADCDLETGDIRIDMEGGLEIVISGNSGPYESYRLYDGQKETIV